MALSCHLLEPARCGMGLGLSGTAPMLQAPGPPDGARGVRQGLKHGAVPGLRAGAGHRAPALFRHPPQRPWAHRLGCLTFSAGCTQIYL